MSDYDVVPPLRCSQTVELPGDDRATTSPSDTRRSTSKNRPLPEIVIPGGRASDLAYEPVSPANNAVFHEYLDAAGWRVNVPEPRLKAAQVAPSDIARMRSGNRNVFAWGSDRRVYIADPNRTKQIASYDPTLLPPEQEWDAARTDPNTAFEYHFRMALQSSGAVWLQWIKHPEQRLRAAEIKLEAMDSLLTMRPNDPQLRKAFAHAKAQELAARRTRDALKRQFDIMRNKVFKTDEEETRVAEELEAEGFDTTGFHAIAKKMSTPWDVRNHGKEVRAQVPAKVAGLKGSNSSSS